MRFVNGAPWRDGGHGLSNLSHRSYGMTVAKWGHREKGKVGVVEWGSTWRYLVGGMGVREEGGVR